MRVSRDAEAAGSTSSLQPSSEDHSASPPADGEHTGVPLVRIIEEADSASDVAQAHKTPGSEACSGPAQELNVRTPTASRSNSQPTLAAALHDSCRCKARCPTCGKWTPALQTELREKLDLIIKLLVSAQSAAPSMPAAVPSHHAKQAFALAESAEIEEARAPLQRAGSDVVRTGSDVEAFPQTGQPPPAEARMGDGEIGAGVSLGGTLPDAGGDKQKSIPRASRPTSMAVPRIETRTEDRQVATVTPTVSEPPEPCVDSTQPSGLLPEVVLDAQEENAWTREPPNAGGNSVAARSEESRVHAKVLVLSHALCIVYPALKSRCCRQTPWALTCSP